MVRSCAVSAICKQGSRSVVLRVDLCVLYSSQWPCDGDHVDYDLRLIKTLDEISSLALARFPLEFRKLLHINTTFVVINIVLQSLEAAAARDAFDVHGVTAFR